MVLMIFVRGLLVNRIRTFQTLKTRIVKSQRCGFFCTTDGHRSPGRDGIVGVAGQIQIAGYVNRIAVVEFATDSFCRMLTRAPQNQSFHRVFACLLSEYIQIVIIPGIFVSEGMSCLAFVGIASRPLVKFLSLGRLQGDNGILTAELIPDRHADQFIEIGIVAISQRNGTFNVIRRVGRAPGSHLQIQGFGLIGTQAIANQQSPCGSISGGAGNGVFASEKNAVIGGGIPVAGGPAHQAAEIGTCIQFSSSDSDARFCRPVNIQRLKIHRRFQPAAAHQAAMGVPAIGIDCGRGGAALQIDSAVGGTLTNEPGCCRITDICAGIFNGNSHLRGHILISNRPLLISSHTGRRNQVVCPGSSFESCRNGPIYRNIFYRCFDTFFADIREQRQSAMMIVVVIDVVHIQRIVNSAHAQRYSVSTAVEGACEWLHRIYFVFGPDPNAVIPSDTKEAGLSQVNIVHQNYILLLAGVYFRLE